MLLVRGEGGALVWWREEHCASTKWRRMEGRGGERGRGGGLVSTADQVGKKFSQELK